MNTDSDTGNQIEEATGNAPSVNEDGLLKPQDAARYMSFSLRTLWDWEKDGLVGCYRRGHWVRFAIRDLDAALAKFYRPARSQAPRKRRMGRLGQDGRNA